MRGRSYNLTLLRVAILTLLRSHGRSYGEALRSEISEVLPEISTRAKIYVALARLENAGLIRLLGVEPHPLGGQLPPVKFYQLTNAGEKFLNEAARDLDKIRSLLELSSKS